MKLAVIAHDGKKADMVAFLNRHYEFMHSAMPKLQHKWQNIKYKWCYSSETRLGNTLTNRTYKC